MNVIMLTLLLIVIGTFIKHGLVQRVADWPYSSFHRYVRLGLLPSDWAGDFAEPDDEYGESSV